MALKKFQSRRDSALGSRYDRQPALDIRDYRARPGFDSTDAINNAFADGVNLGLEVLIPEGTWPITGPLQWNNAFPRIRGVPGRTFIQPDAQDYDWLTVGDGTAVVNGPGVAYIEGIRLSNTSLPPAPLGLTSGLVLNATRGVHVKDVWVRHAPIGFNLINNNFGSSFTNCRTQFSECRVGLYLKREGGVIGQQTGGFGAGNDMPLFNCWLSGLDAGVWFEGGGNYSFFGGQIGVGQDAGSVNDLRGNVIVNATMEGDGSLASAVPATVGSGTIAFYSTSFEGTHQGWTLRVWRGGCKIECHSCFFSGKTGAQGVYKMAGTTGHVLGAQDIVTLTNCAFTGDWALDPPVVFNADSTNRPVYLDIGSHPSGVLTFAGGGSIFFLDNGLFARNQTGSGGRVWSTGSETWTQHGVRFRKLSGIDAVDMSFDQGTTWNRITTTLV